MQIILYSQTNELVFLDVMINDYCFHDTLFKIGTCDVLIVLHWPFSQFHPNFILGCNELTVYCDKILSKNDN